MPHDFRGSVIYDLLPELWLQAGDAGSRMMTGVLRQGAQGTRVLMAEGRRKNGFQPLAGTMARIVDPILRRQAGLNIQLLENWPEIVGQDIAGMTQPLKIVWARRAAGDDMFRPATLVVACEGFSAMKLQHESGEVIQRINGFFGFFAVSRLKIEQKPLRPVMPSGPRKGAVDEVQKNRLHKEIADIEDSALRRSLLMLGMDILGERNRKADKKA